MTKNTFAALLVGFTLISCGASGSDTKLSQLRLATQKVLVEHGYHDVDVAELKTAQMAQINHIGNDSSKGAAARHGQIGAVVNGSIIRDIFK